MSKLSDQVVDLYQRHALAWDAARAHARPAGERGWIARFLALIPPGGQVLDLGCGSGEPIARDLNEAGRRVTGVEAAPALLAMCRARFPGADWILADMRRLDLGLRFDGVIAWHSLFHLSEADQEAMFGVFAAHAGPGAALMFTSGPERGETVGGFQGEPLYHASLDAQGYRALLDRHGFTLVDHAVRDVACGGATIWLATA
jgi:SAM-dependent methyltransferase